ncbi:MAG: hypothetical protein JW795_23520, partial [Chitinivibrionales bacterium]|nr:hypothetical protein [Chitinivibrionales bacterium]
MKKPFVSCLCGIFFITSLWAGVIEHTYSFSTYTIIKTAQGYDELSIDNSMPLARVGEPRIPYRAVVLMLPPSEEAVSMEVTYCDRIDLPQRLLLAPQQPTVPISVPNHSAFQKNEAAYASDLLIPSRIQHEVTTRYMNGYALATAQITPVRYNAANRQAFLYQKVIVKINAQAVRQSQNNIQTIDKDPFITQKVTSTVDNPSMMGCYSTCSRSPSDYEMLIITVKQFQSEFDKLVNYYGGRNFRCKQAFVEEISSSGTGKDTQEK